MNEAKRRAKARKAQRRTAKRQRVASGQCNKCGASDQSVRQRWQKFRTGEWHLREECGECGKFRRYLPQSASEREAPGL